MTKIILLNHKMNLTKEETASYLDYLHHINIDYQLIIAPTSIYLAKYLEETNYDIACQNAYFEQEGPYTGEISLPQLKSLGVKYLIVGHSERRNLFGETDDIINKKIVSCQKNDLKPIICIGETLSDYQEENTNIVLNRKLNASLLGIDNIKKIIIAYEPEYAIGNNQELDLEHITKVVSYLTELVKTSYQITPTILYGGSINENNIQDILRIPHLGGILIGETSSNLSKLNKIFNKLEK